MPENNAPLPDGFQLNGYTIDRRLSLGGFSIVYLAHDNHLRQYAIKEYLPNTLALRSNGEIRPEIPEEHLGLFRHGLKCFFEEGKALSRLSHPNVVRVTDFFRANDTVYLVMKYLNGCTLQVYSRKSQNATDEFFLRNLFFHLMSGLRMVHAQKLLHLDIKPANIYVCANKVPILLDFGSVRKALAKAQTSPISPMYTPGFASPEHYGNREDIGPWSDIYGVGATLYACLSKSTPQPADERLKDDQLQSAAKRWKGEFSPLFLETIDHCLRLDHRERPQSAFTLQKTLAYPDEAKRASWFSRLTPRLFSLRGRMPALWKSRPETREPKKL